MEGTCPPSTGPTWPFECEMGTDSVKTRELGDFLLKLFQEIGRHSGQAVEEGLKRSEQE